MDGQQPNTTKAFWSFSAREQTEILEIAMVAIADDNVRAIVGDTLDLADDYLDELYEKIKTHTESDLQDRVDAARQEVKDVTYNLDTGETDAFDTVAHLVDAEKRLARLESIKGDD